MRRAPSPTAKLMSDAISSPPMCEWIGHVMCDRSNRHPRRSGKPPSSHPCPRAGEGGPQAGPSIPERIALRQAVQERACNIAATSRSQAAQSALEAVLSSLAISAARSADDNRVRTALPCSR